MPKIYGVILSPFVRKVRVALAEKNIAYELEPVLPFGPREEFLKISPLGKIPVYREGDFTLPDSSAIIAYLEHTHPEPPLYPSRPQERGRSLFLEEYADTRLVESMLAPFVQRIVNKRFLGKEADEERVREALEEKLPPCLDYLESQIDGSDGIVSEGFSVADIAVASPFVNLAHAGETIDAGRWPKLASYLERVHGRPSFKAIIAEETDALT